MTIPMTHMNDDGQPLCRNGRARLSTHEHVHVTCLRCQLWIKRAMRKAHRRWHAMRDDKTMCGAESCYTMTDVVFNKSTEFRCRACWYGINGCL